MSLQDAVNAEDGIRVVLRITDLQDADGESVNGVADTGTVTVNLSYWTAKFGESSPNGPLGTLLSALIATIGRVIGRTKATEAEVEARLDELRQWIASWAHEAFAERKPVN
jgi:hypothetical protein